MREVVVVVVVVVGGLRGCWMVVSGGRTSAAWN